MNVKHRSIRGVVERHRQKPILTDLTSRFTIACRKLISASDRHYVKRLSFLRPLIAKRLDKSLLNMINLRRSGGSTGCDQHALPAISLFSHRAGPC